MLFDTKRRMSSAQAAVKKLELLFRDVKLENQRSSPDYVPTSIDSRCCEIHGKHYKENCAYRRGSLNRSSLTSLTPRKEIHPSSFPNTLRRNPLGSSTGTLNFRKDSYLSNYTPLYRDDLGKSVGNLKKDSLSTYNSPLRRDYVAKSMVNLQRPSSSLSKPLSNLFTSTTTIRETLNRKGNTNLKSCLAGSTAGSVRSNLNVTLKSEPSYDTTDYGRKYGSGLYNRRSSIDKLRFSTDSLDNLKKSSWDMGRRGSTGSSGGWDDPIWEERAKSHENCRHWFIPRYRTIRPCNRSKPTNIYYVRPICACKICMLMRRCKKTY